MAKVAEAEAKSEMKSEIKCEVTSEVTQQMIIEVCKAIAGECCADKSDLAIVLKEKDEKGDSSANAGSEHGPSDLEIWISAILSAFSVGKGSAKPGGNTDAKKSIKDNDDAYSKLFFAGRTINHYKMPDYSKLFCSIDVYRAAGSHHLYSSYSTYADVKDDIKDDASLALPDVQTLIQDAVMENIFGFSMNRITLDQKEDFKYFRLFNKSYIELMYSISI